MEGGSISINQRANNNLPQQQNQNSNENINDQDQNFRQNIEKNTLEQIFQQEIDEDDQDLYEDDSGQLLKGIDPIERADSYETSPGLGNKKRNAKLVDNNRFNMKKIKLSPPQTDLKNMSEMSNTSSKQMKTPKMSKQAPIPNYALPTVETFIKDIRNKQLSQNNLILQDEKEQKKNNPMIHYQKTNMSPSSIKNQLIKGADKTKNKYYIETSKSKEGSSLKKPKRDTLFKNTQSQKANLEMKNLNGMMDNSKEEEQEVNMTQDDIFVKYAVTSNSNKSQININTIKKIQNQNHQFLSSREELTKPGQQKQSDKQTVIQTLGVHSDLGIEHSNSVFLNQQSNQTQSRATQGVGKRQKVKITSSKENSNSKNNLFNESFNGQSNVARVNVQRQQNHMISFRLGENQENDEQQLVSIQLENNLTMKRQKVQSNYDQDFSLPYEFQCEIKQNLQQAFPKNKHTLRMRDQKEYVVMALNNHSRKNFEDNENVTMFVGSIDNKKKINFKERQEKILKRREDQQRIRDQQFVEKQKLQELMRQNKQIQNFSEKRGSFDYYDDESPNIKKTTKSKDKGQNDGRINNETSKLLYPMNITAIDQIKEQEKIQQKLDEKSINVEDENQSDPEKQEEPKNKKLLLNKFKSDIFNQTPSIYNVNVNFRDMDARSSIEHYEFIKKDIIQKQINKLINANNTEETKTQSKMRHSPILINHNLQQKNTTLKFFTKRNNSGNIEQAYSQTTLVLSGNNTPLPYMNRRKEKFLKQINQEQDELMEQLQIKKRLLDFKQLKPNKLFHSFVTNMQTLDMPDENRFKQLQDTIHQASQQFFSQKLRPMHSTYSFDSWRSIIEKKIDLGFSCKSDSNIKLPKKFGLEIGKFGFRKARKYQSAQKLEREVKSLDELQMTQRSLSVKNKFEPDEQVVYPKFDKHISAQKQNILRMRWYMNEQANKQTKYETNAEILFSEKTGQTQQETQAQDMRSKLLQKVRLHLKQRVQDKHSDKHQFRKLGKCAKKDQMPQDEDSINELEERSVKKYNQDMGYQILKPSKLVVEKLKSLRESMISKASSPNKFQDNNQLIRLQAVGMFDNQNQDLIEMFPAQQQNGKKTSIKSALYNTNIAEKEITQASENKQNSDNKTKAVQSNIYTDYFNSIDNKEHKKQLKQETDNNEYFPNQENDSQIQQNLLKVKNQPYQTINQSYNADTDHFSNPSLKFPTNNTTIFQNNKYVKLSKHLSKRDQLNQIQQLFRENQINPVQKNYDQNLVSLQDLNNNQQEQNNLDLVHRQRLMINQKKPKTAGAARIKKYNQINRITSDSSYAKVDIFGNPNVAIENQNATRIEHEIEEDREIQSENDNQNDIQFNSQTHIWDISRDDQWNHSIRTKKQRLLYGFGSVARNQASSIKHRFGEQDPKAVTMYANPMKIQSDFNSSLQLTTNNIININNILPQSDPLSITQSQMYKIKSAENTLKFNRPDFQFQENIFNNPSINQQNNLTNKVQNLQDDQTFQDKDNDNFQKSQDRSNQIEYQHKIVIPENLLQAYENVKIEYDKKLQKVQSNFITKNIEDTFDSQKIKMANNQAEILHKFRRQLEQQNFQDDKQQEKCGFFCYKQKDNYRNLKHFKDNYQKINNIQIKPLFNIHQQNQQQLQQSFQPYDYFDKNNLFQKSSIQLFNTSQVNFNDEAQEFQKVLRPTTVQNSLRSRIQVQKQHQSNKQSKKQQQQQSSQNLLPILSNIQTICKLKIQEHIAEKLDSNNQFNIYSKEMNKILEDQGELGQAVSQYIELERAQIENLKDKMLRRELKKKQQQACVDKLNEQEDTLDDNKLLSIKEIYIDMKRNEELDYVNFLSNQVIQKCKNQKEESEKYMSRKFKKPKIWKLKYEGVIGPISYDACNFQ